MRCVASLVTLRPALLSSLQPEHDAPPRVYLATSLEALGLRGVECIREAAFVVGRRSEAFCLLLLTPVNEIGSLVDAKVVQVQQRANEHGWSQEAQCYTRALFVQSTESNHRHTQDLHEIASFFIVVVGFVAPQVVSIYSREVRSSL